MPYLSLSITDVLLRLGLGRRLSGTFVRSIELNPNNGETLSYYALFLVFRRGTWMRPWLSQPHKALGVDPLAPLINMNVGWTYFAAGSASRGPAAGREDDRERSHFDAVHRLQGAIHLSAGEYRAAVGQLRSAVSAGGHQVVGG